MSHQINNATFADIQDTIVMALATPHPQLSFSREDHLKRVLLDLLVDDEGWQGSPATMGRRVATAMSGLVDEHELCTAE